MRVPRGRQRYVDQDHEVVTALARRSKDVKPSAARFNVSGHPPPLPNSVESTDVVYDEAALLSVAL